MLTFCNENADITKFKGIMALYDIISKTKYLCVITYHISSFCHNPNEYKEINLGGPFMGSFSGERDPPLNEPIKGPPRQWTLFNKQ